jgi:hypothetical protein
MDIVTGTGPAPVIKRQDFFASIKQAGKKVINMKNLEGVKDIVHQSKGYLEDNMVVDELKQAPRASYIGDKGDKITSAKELLYGQRSKKHAKIINVDYQTSKSVASNQDTIFIGDSQGNMSAYNFLTN